MLTLTLWNSAETTQHQIELYDHAPVNLTYQFMDAQNINQTRGAYSQVFRVPATKKNTDFFGAIYEASIRTSGGLVNSNYNVKRKIKATLANDTILLMTGYVQLKAVYIQKEDFADIELAFFADTNDFAKDVGDSMIGDLDTSSIATILKASNLANSWVLGLHSGNVVFGLMDKGQNWSFADFNNPPWSITEGLYQSDFTPFVRIKWILDQIFSEAGHTYDSTFFDSTDFSKMYLPAFNGSIVPLSSNKEPEQQLALATLPTDLTGVVNSYFKLGLQDSTGGFDYGGNFNNAVNGYIAPYNAIYLVRLTMTRSDDQTTYPSGIDIALFKNGTIFKYVEGQQGSSFSIDISVTLLTNDTIDMRMKTRGGGNGRILGNYTASETSMEIIAVQGPVTGQTIDISANFPEFKQIDFIQSLQKMFNLVFVPDKNKPKHLLIEPLKDYTETGNTKNWTNIVDYSKDVVLKPTSELQAKQYDWTYTKGGDFITSLIHSQTNRVYGRYQVTDPENDFAVNSKTIQNGFSPYLVSYIPNSVIPIHRAIDVAGKALGKPLPKIAYYHGFTGTVPPIYVNSDTFVVSSIGLLPSFSNYSSFNIELNDNDLNYGYEFPFINHEVHPLKTLYYKYWMNYVNELYSSQARTLTAFIYLTPVDIQQFEYSDKIFIKDSYYRIMKISNYDATTGGSVQVELLKILSDLKDCSTTPTSQNGDGSLRFDSTLGNYGNQTCCERYGYRWLPRIGKCYPQTAQIPPDTYE